jgi:hypothetical protein
MEQLNVSLTVNDLQSMIGLREMTIEGKNRIIAALQEKNQFLESELGKAKKDLDDLKSLAVLGDVTAASPG